MAASPDVTNKETSLEFYLETEWVRVSLSSQKSSVTAECRHVSDFAVLAASLFCLDRTNQALLGGLTSQLKRTARTAIHVSLLAGACAPFFAENAQNVTCPSFSDPETKHPEEVIDGRLAEPKPLRNEYSATWETGPEDNQIILRHILRSKRKKRKTTLFWDEETGVHWVDIEDAIETELDQLNLILGLYQAFCVTTGRDLLSAVSSIMEMTGRFLDTKLMIKRANQLAMDAAGYTEPLAVSNENLLINESPCELEATLPSAECISIRLQDETPEVQTTPPYPALEAELLYLIERDHELGVDHEETMEILRLSAEKSQTLFDFLLLAAKNLDPTDEEDNDETTEDEPDEPLQADQNPHQFASGWVFDFLKNNPGHANDLLNAKIKDEATYLDREHLLKDEPRTAAGSYRTQSMITDAGNPTDVARCSPPWLRRLPLSALQCQPPLERDLVALGIKVLSDLDSHSTESILVDGTAQLQDLSDFATTLMGIIENGAEAANAHKRHAGRSHQGNITRALHGVPRWIKNLPIRVFKPPQSAVQAFGRANIRLVSDLSAYTEEDLIAKEGMSKVALQALVDKLARADDKCKTYPRQGVELRQELENAERLLDATSRRIFTEYISSMRPQQSLTKLASGLNTSSDETENLLQAAIDLCDEKMSWPSVLTMRLAEAGLIANSPILFSEFLGGDPWLSTSLDRPQTIKNLAPLLTKQAVNIAEIKGKDYVAPFTTSEWTALVKDGKRELKKAIRDDPHVVSCRAKLSPMLQGHTQMFFNLFWAEVTEAYDVIGSGPSEKLQKKIRNIRSKIVTCLNKSKRAMSAEEIAVKLRIITLGADVPPSVAANAERVAFKFGEGRYGLIKHLPVSVPQAQEIASAAAQLIVDHNVDYRWYTGDILAFLKERNVANTVPLEERDLFAILSVTQSLSPRRDSTWSHPQARTEPLLVHQPSLKPAGKRNKDEAAQTSTTAENPETTLWVDLFKSEFPQLADEIEQALIINDSSYWKREANLSDDTRTKIGLFRTLKFADEPENPADVARCGPPWAGDLPIDLLRPTKRLRATLLEKQITRIADLEPLSGGSFPELKLIGPLTMAILAKNLIELIAEGPAAAIRKSQKLAIDPLDPEAEVK